MCFRRRISIYFLALARVISSLATQNCGGLLPSGSTTDPQQFAAIEFDYLIVGGGTAGLAVASRLTEDEKIEVGVIEAGLLHQNDPLIDIPLNAGLASGNPLYDWNFVTVPQSGANNRSIAATRGKLLGGSSGLNFLAWNRASKVEYDAWQLFAPNGEWNWKGILPYLKKATAVFPNQINPIPGIPRNDASAFNPQDVGFHGPIQSSFNVFYPDPVPIYVEALNTMGVDTNTNPDNGTITGVTNSRSNVDRITGTRSYAASTYYCRAASRKNFHVLMGAQATKILLNPADNNDKGKLKATGVQFSSDSRMFIANASKEVVLSAGVYQSPQLLELSGIGNRTILEGLGIQNLIDLPAVGENLQDHLSISVQYQLKPGFLTFDELRNNASFAAEQAALYNRSHTGMLAATNSVLTFLPPSLFLNNEEREALLRTFNQVVARSDSSLLQAMQFDIQRKWLEQGVVPQLEVILFSNSFNAPVANESYITILANGLHHFNRGSVHINTSVALSPPVIDPNWLTNEFDLMLMLLGLKFIQKLGETVPLSNVIQKITAPPPNVHNDSALTNFIRQTINSGQHPMGTAAMAPRELGGVVDGGLKVYGTTNLRVCDASIIPIHLGTHLQSAVYAIAEKLADIIKHEGR